MITNKRMLYVISITLVVVLLGSFVVISTKQASDSYEEEIALANYQQSIAAIEAYMESYKEDQSYFGVRKQWEKDQAAVPNQQYSIQVQQISGGTSYSGSESKSYGSSVLSVKPEDQLTFDVEVAEEGLYELWFDYYILANTVLKPELSIEINQQSQFNEMNNLKLAMDWSVQRLTGTNKYDRYGDELTPQSKLVSEWKQEGLMDPNAFYVEPLKFKFAKGINHVQITFREGNVLLGKVLVQNTSSTTPTYQEYKSTLPSQDAAKDALVTIEAEDIAIKSRQSIRAKYIRDPEITPYSYKRRLLNVLDGSSFGDSGDRIEYKFNVEESGLYQLSLKYSQDTNKGMSTHRRIEMDHAVPFQELEYYHFEYTSGWENHTLQNRKGEPYEIYLEKGEHTLTLSIDNSKVRDIYHELLTTLDSMDYVAREVKKLTGGLVDREREWKIEKYIPDIKAYLQGISAKLALQKQALVQYVGRDDLPVVTELSIAQELVQEFAQDPEELPHYFNKFNEGQSSAYGRIKTILPILVYNPLHLDKLYIHSGEELPEDEVGLMTSSVEQAKAFFYSFINPKYNTRSADDEETIDVWVNQSRLYVEIMQRMIDEDFTPNTGIKVNLSILPDENKIILSNAANSTPDAAMGVSYGRPFELALRGITEDLSQYDGFDELAKQFNPNAFISLIYDEGVYGVPETQNVKLLFYRKDILEFLGEEPPETWEEVISLIPMLQRYGMNFFTPLGSDSAFKGFDTTTPFIYQFGGRLYNETGSETIINKGGAYEAFEFMTDLFTVYNMPITTSEFYQNFRNGKTPVGIGDANTYIQLKHAAPELAGQWGVMPIPGVKNEEGVIERWDPTFGSSSLIFSRSDKKEKAWEFIQWWASSKVQSDFSYHIQSTLGEKFLYMTANLEGFKNSAWPSDSKSVILEQWKWIQSTGRVPGDYMVERELSNAWSRVVFNRQNPRTAIDQAVKIINRELKRKLEEFDYMEDGTMIRPYQVPMIDNIQKWVDVDG